MSRSVFMRARLCVFVRGQYIARIKGGLIRECVCDSKKGTQCVRQQIAVGGYRIVYFFEKWNVVITAVIKGSRRCFFLTSSSSTLRHLMACLHVRHRNRSTSMFQKPFGITN